MKKTSICLVKNGVLRMFRSINIGGRYLTDFITRDLEIPYAEAQRLKHHSGQLITEGLDTSGFSKDENRLSLALTQSIQPLLKELGRTIYAFKTWEKSPIEKLLFLGEQVN